MYTPSSNTTLNSEKSGLGGFHVCLLKKTKMRELEFVRPHTTALRTQKLAEMHWTTLNYPPYSPDISPCDFHMSGFLKEALGGERFANDQQVEQFVRR